MDTNDQDVVNAISQGDFIDTITIEGDVDGLFEQVSDRLSDWNAQLDKG